jgi:microcystin degradation protein MlrC
MRIAFAEIAQETDSFSPIVAELADFEATGLYSGEEMLEKSRGVGSLGGFLEIAENHERSVELVPLLRAWGGAGGTITGHTFEHLLEWYLAELEQCGEVDGVFLSLHGAAAADNEDDVEGHVLWRTRQVVGADVPIVVAVDHHANITKRMVEYADALIGHETQPHDPPATGRKAAKLLFRMLRREVQARMTWRKIPMITPQDQFLTAAGPMKVWFDAARAWERKPKVLDVSPYPMQPWLDVEEGGWAVVVHTDDDIELAESIAQQMAELAWSLREKFWASERVAPDEAVRQAIANREGLVILSDTGDSVYGGAPGDNTTLLRALLNGRLTGPALVPLVDPAAVQSAMAAGVGAKLSLELGGVMDSRFCEPVTAEVEVVATSSGYIADMEERGEYELGDTVLLKSGHVYIVLLDHRSFAINHPVLYTHLGLDIAEARMVVVKTASNFQFFAPWRKQLIRVDTPGTTQSDLKAFDWQRITRPVWPLDPVERLF